MKRHFLYGSINIGAYFCQIEIEPAGMGLHLWEQGTWDRLETVKQILSHILTLDDKSVLCDQGLKSFNNR